MKHSGWIAALSTVAILGQARPSQTLELKDSFHQGGTKKTTQEQIGLCIRQHAWIAYFKDGGGKMAAVRDTANTDHDDDWIGLRFTEYDGPRIRLGVLKVINKALAPEGGQNAQFQAQVSGIQEMLAVALSDTKRFDVIEPKRIQEFQQQDKAEPSPKTIINIGKVLGAQYLVYSTVNEWDPGRGTSSARPGRSFKGEKKESEIAITFIVTDVATGQILYLTAERARVGARTFRIAPDRSDENTLISYAIKACQQSGVQDRYVPP
jgi:hypothetical protein